jgi:hypothetical protein
VAAESIRITIPERELPGLRAIAHTDILLLERLAEALPQEPPTVDPDPLARAVAARTGVDAAVVERVVPALWRLALVQRRFEVAPDDFLRTLSARLSELGPERWSANDAEAWAQRQNAISRMLVSDGPLATGAKAADLLMEQQLVFCTARILSDLRPVFNEAAEALQGFLPFHTLAVTYHEGGETKTIYFAMDASDLKRLARQIDRAQRKERILRDDLQASGRRTIQTEPDKDGG